MNKTLKLMLVALITAAGFVVGGFLLSGIASADVDCTGGPGNSGSCDNLQDGDNDSSTDQSGTSASGDAVGGQVVGVVSSGDASVDATNRSEDVDISTGDTTAENAAANFTGQNDGSADVSAADVISAEADNSQDGDNSSDVVQAAEATSGDGVGGSVIGVVTSAGGSADVVAANTSEDVDIDTGDGDASNELSAFVGQEDGDATIGVEAADVDCTGGPGNSGSCDNLQDGDNDLSADQSATGSSGDGVGGQVLGIVSAGDASVDATNHSEDVDVETGDGDASNDFAAFVGQNDGTLDVAAADVLAGEADNAQDGDNQKELSQDAVASTGDAVGGQVAGVVTSAGGSADLVLANTSEDVDGETGDSDFNNTDEEFVGQNDGDITVGLEEIDV